MNTGNDDKRPVRHNLKTASFENHRRQMNIRRAELSSRIRKTRRSHTIQVKRRINASHFQNAATASSASFATTQLPNDNISSLQSAQTAEDALDMVVTSQNHQNHNLREQQHHHNYLDAALQALSSFLAQSTTLKTVSSSSVAAELAASTSSSNVTNLPIDHRAPQLMVILGKILRENCERAENIPLCLHATRILTNLAAMDSSDTSSSSASPSEQYYGLASQSWCDVMIESDCIIPSLIGIMHSFYNRFSNPYKITTDDNTIMNDYEQYRNLLLLSLSLCKQVVWILGNIAGDSQHARGALVDTIRKSNLTSTHTATSDQNHDTSNTTTLRVEEERFTIIIHLVKLFRLATSDNVNINNDTYLLNEWLGLARNSIWTLSNLARGGNTAALPFVGMKSSNGCGVLSIFDFTSILSRAHQFNPADMTDEILDQEDKLTWWHLCLEVYWLLAFITAKEDEVVDILFRNSDKFFPIFSWHLHLMTNAIFVGVYVPHSSRSTYQIEFAKRMVIPCIRIIGNIATACHGRFVPMLLQTSYVCSPDLPAIDRNVTITQTLVTWMSYIADSKSSITTHGDIHAIGAEVAWAIGTLLCDAGHAPPHPSTIIACPMFLPVLCRLFVCGRAPMTLRREVLAALWNALAEPPISTEGDSMTADSCTLQVRDEILLQIYRTESIIPVLMEAISSSDFDYMRPALLIVDAMHRRLITDHDNTVLHKFEEENCSDRLENICEIASMKMNYGASDNWDIARGDDSIQEDCAEIASKLIDDFYSDNNCEEMDFEGIGFQAPSFNSNQRLCLETLDSVNQGGNNGNNTLLGAGRGRGRVMPAWMQQSPII